MTETTATTAVETPAMVGPPVPAEPEPTPTPTPVASSSPAAVDFSIAEFLEDPPSVLIYGVPGAGKSTDIFKAFPNSLFLLSARGVLRPAASFIRDNQNLGLYMPLPLLDEQGSANKIEFESTPDGGRTLFWTAKESKNKTPTHVLPGIRRGAYIVVPEFGVNETRVNNWTALKTYCDSFVARAKKDPSRYDALVIDEMSAFSTRIYEDIKADKRFLTPAGKPDGWKVSAEVAVFHRYLGRYIPSQSKKAIIMACHSVEPKYHDDKEDPRYGRLKYLGGPKFAVGSLTESVTADFDIVLELRVVDSLSGVERVYATSAEPLRAHKFRDFAIKAKEKIGLRELLTRAAYRI